MVIGDAIDLGHRAGTTFTIAQLLTWEAGDQRNPTMVYLRALIGHAAAWLFEVSCTLRY